MEALFQPVEAMDERLLLEWCRLRGAVNGVTDQFEGALGIATPVFMPLRQFDEGKPVPVIFKEHLLPEADRLLPPAVPLVDERKHPSGFPRGGLPS